MNKEKINNYIDSQIEWWENRLKKSEELDNDCIGKDLFIAEEKSSLNVLKDIRAFINSGLAD